MSVVTIVGSGMMGTAIGFPARENGHEVRLVGTPLDREIIEHARATGEHLTLKRRIPEGMKYYQIDELDEALRGADVLGPTHALPELLAGGAVVALQWRYKNTLLSIAAGTALYMVLVQAVFV